MKVAKQPRAARTKHTPDELSAAVRDVASYLRRDSEPFVRDCTRGEVRTLERQIREVVPDVKIHVIAKGSLSDVHFYIPGRTKGALGKRGPGRTETPPAAWWLPQWLNRRYPPSRPPDPGRVESRIVPPCSSRPSRITRRALATFDAQLLYDLLRLDDISTQAARRVANQPAERARIAALRQEERTWRTVTTTIARAIEMASDARLRTLRSYSFPSSGALLPTANYPIAFASPEAIDDERIPTWARHDDMPGRRIDIVEVEAINVLSWIANDAQSLANKAEEEIVKAVELARMSGRQAKAIVRERVAVLVKELQDADWTLLDIADLIAASGTDWTEPPSPLSARYPYDWTSKARRTEPNRVALADWLRDQMRAPKREKARLQSPKKRPDRRR